MQAVESKSGTRRSEESAQRPHDTLDSSVNEVHLTAALLSQYSLFLNRQSPSKQAYQTCLWS